MTETCEYIKGQLFMQAIIVDVVFFFFTQNKTIYQIGKDIGYCIGRVLGS